MMRKIEGQESFFHKSDENITYHCVQVVQLKRKISKELIKNSVGHLIEKFQILQQGAVVKNGEYFFKTINKYKEKFFESNYFEIEKKEENWKEIFQKEIKDGWKHYIETKVELNKEQDEFSFAFGFMWKFYFLQSQTNDEFDLILCIDHLISDGITICVLIGELMNFIHLQMNQKEINYEMIKISPSLTQLIDKNEKYETSYLSNQLCGFDFDAKPNEFFKLNQDFSFCELNGEKLIKLSKEHKVTVNSIISAAIIISFIKHFSRKEYGKFLNVWTPMSLRKFFNLDPKILGMLVTFLVVEMEAKEEYTKEENFWKLAILFHEKIQELMKL
jgi:hypothetical protein